MILFVLLVLVQAQNAPPTLPAPAVKQLNESVTAAERHASHRWRDVAPFDAKGRLHGVVEIPLGNRRKREFDMKANGLRLDRTMPASLGGYPVNYGFVPQTVSYDGDPFDVLVLGPAIPAGTPVTGIIVGIMHMEDEKGLDSKAVISPVDRSGRARYRLTQADRDRMTAFFDAYKRHEPGKFSRVTGWGSAEEARAWVNTTHAFFQECRGRTSGCTVTAPAVR